MATAKKAAVRTAIKAAVAHAALQLEDFLANANAHLQERLKLPIVTNENMQAYAENLKNEVVKRVEAGEIEAEHKGQELLDYLTKKLHIPKK